MIAVTATSFYSCGTKINTNQTGNINGIITEDLQGWSDASKMAVMYMKEKYGEPAEKTSEMMLWENTGQ